MSKKKILVTGGAGYIGSALIRQLLDSGYTVKVLDCLIFKKNPLTEVLNKIELLNKDIRRAKQKDFEDIYAVIHLAGFSTDPTSQYNPRLTDIINHLATEHLAKLARAAGIKRFVYASTCSIYFTFDTPLTPPLYKETNEVNPISPYSLTKRCSEQVLWGMTGTDFQPTIFRKGTLYGLSPRMRFDLVLNSFAKDAHQSKQITVNSGGQVWRPMIDLQDVVKAYIQCIEMPLGKVGGEIFNISNNNWNIGELAIMVKKTLKKERGVDIKIDTKPFGLTRNYNADNSKFVKTFKYRPARKISDAFLEVWDYLDNNKKIDPSKDIYYGSKWYSNFFKTKKGKDYEKLAI